MSLSDLAPTNTKRAREGAAKAFLKFLKDEDVGWDYLETCMTRESAPLILEAVVDKFSMYLAFKEGRKGQLLARHSIMQYYRQAKNWLLDQFPQYRAAVDKNLLKKGQVLERHCMKRESGTFVNKAPACTKKALKQMTEFLYSTAVTATDYQDAALLCLLWYLFGRASDLTLLRKANLSIGAGDIFFVRFIRAKTSEQQGLSLFPDADFATCPLFTIALALITQQSPTVSLLNQLPEQQSMSQAALTPATPLIDLIDHPEAGATLQAAHVDKSKSADASPGIHSYINRVLERVVTKGGVVERLTSHSFRRGGAQHANGAGMCVQWIFDRGAWNMTATNKAFAYVFNTPAEDHKVGRVLSSHDPEKPVPLLTLNAFDSDNQAKIRGVASSLFSSSFGMETTSYNINARVVDPLMAYLLRHYPLLKEAKADGLAVQRIEACAIEKAVAVNELLAWSAHLSCSTSASNTTANTPTPATTIDITEHPIFRHQAALIQQLVQVNHTLDTRMSMMEAKVYNKHERTQPAQATSEDATDNVPPAKRRRTSTASSLKDALYSWYAQAPRMWNSTNAATKHTRSTSKLVVAFLKLFIPDGFELDEKEQCYRDEVLAIGTAAEAKLLLFLRERDIKACGAQNVLKSMRKLHKSGHLNDHIRRYQQLQAVGRIVDPAPSHTNNIIGLVSTSSSALPSKPTKNEVSSSKEFKMLCVAASKEHKIRLSDEAIRHLRLTMNTVVASARLLPEAISVIYASLAERKKRRATLEDVREWLVEPPPAGEEDTEATDGEKQYHVRKLLTWKRVNRQTYYLVDWQPTWEPRAHIHDAVVAAFEKERRLLVRKRFFEDEAVEDNSLNDTEG